MEKNTANRRTLIIVSAVVLLAAVLAVLVFVPGLPTSEYIRYQIARHQLSQLDPAPDVSGGYSQPMTRLELASLINICYGLTQTGDALYTDALSGDTATQMNIALTAGYLQLVDGQAAPDATVTRAMAAAALSKLLHLDEAAAENTLTDVAEADLSAAQAAIDGGYLSARGGAFRPDEELTWGQAVPMLRSALGTVLTADGSYTLRAGAADNVTIHGSAVALCDTSVPGDVILSIGQGAGTITLDGVTIGGRLVIQGSADGILLNNVTCDEIIVDAPGATALRIVATGSTLIGNTRVLSGASLEENYLTADGFVNVSVEAAVALTLQSSVSSLTALSEANVTLPSGCVIASLTAQAPLTLQGEGTLGELSVQQGLTCSQIVPQTTVLSQQGQAELGGMSLPAGPVTISGTDVSAMLADITSLTPGYAAGDDADHVRGNLTLPTQGTGGSAIAWFSSNTQYLTTEGVVTRADYPLGDHLVTLTATLTSGPLTHEVTYSLTVLQKEITPQQSVDADVAAIVLKYGAGDSAESVIHDVVLPTSGANGTVITWASSNPDVLDETGKVTRPLSGGDVTVTLTATVTKQDAAATQTFTLVVLKKVYYSNAQLISEDKSDLHIVFATGDSDSHVTQSMLLPGTGLNGSMVTWNSSNTALVSNSGAVTLPAAGSGDQQVTLTATLTLGGQKASKTFTVTVIAPTPAPTATPAVT